MQPIEIILTPTFNKSLARLSPQDQKQVDLAVMQFWRTPDAPGLRWHSLNMREKRFHSISPNMDLRVIVMADGPRRVMMYADHHDKAYAWADGRQFERHPVTGSGQIVEFEEVVREQIVYVTKEVEAPPLFAAEEDSYLISLGVPPVYLEWVRKVADEDALIQLCQRLPEEAVEALLSLFSGERPEPAPATADADPFETPDARRRFWIAADEKALARALEAPWTEWTVFLHPSQRDAVTRNFNGPARITGSAGTGKSVVAMHRAAELARASQGGRLFLTTFSRALSYRLSEGMDRLLGSASTARGRVTVAHLHAHAAEVLQDAGRNVQVIDEGKLKEWIAEIRGDLDPGWSDAFLASEWSAVVDYWGIRDFAGYRAIQRTGRGKALSPRDRKLIWPVFEEVRRRMATEGCMTWGDLCEAAGRLLTEQGLYPFRHVIVDEAQDLGPRELAFVARLAPSGPRSLFFVGDTGQRIYRWPFAWSAVGLDIRGRARRLTVNYRTSQQIRRFADRLLPTRIEGPDGLTEERVTISLLSGPEPEIIPCADSGAEREVLANWLTSQLDRGVTAPEIAILARTGNIHQRTTYPVLSKLNLQHCALTEPEPPDDTVSAGTLHTAKGLEFRAVAVIGCEAAMLPLPAAIAAENGEVAKAIARERERNLLYVGFTRARESLLVTHVGPPSSFLSDLDQTGETRP